MPAYSGCGACARVSSTPACCSEPLLQDTAFDVFAPSPGQIRDLLERRRDVGMTQRHDGSPSASPSARWRTLCATQPKEVAAATARRTIDPIVGRPFALQPGLPSMRGALKNGT